ncbi:MAG: type IV secretion system DNA-binding domain-containing protein [bacterium]|nr:type IV secretion system DNA-binding domain-containing protein [bacterium]
MASKDDITYFAEADFRNKKERFGIKRGDRPRHMYVIGKTGMGKSTLLENMAIQDIQNGEGLAVMDPHGSMAEKLLDYVPEHRIKDVIYFAPFDAGFPLSFNVMEDVGPDKRHLVTSGLMSAFKKIWVDAWSGRMEYILTNTILALLEYPDATLLGVNRMLSDKEYRKKVVENVTDPSIKAFWTDEFAKYNERYMQEAGDAIKNKVGQFTANPIIRNVIGQPKSSFDIRKLMDEKKILIMNLSKGRLGEQNSDLLGSMLVTKIYLAAMSRADATAQEMARLPDFYLYVDEFQSFANESFADILSEARKYKLNLIIAHQYVEQMPEEVRAAVFGNVGTTIAFRVGPLDAELLERVFAPVFTQENLVNLGFAQVYMTLMIDGIGSKPFSAQTIAPIKPPERSFKDAILEHTRKTFARPRTEVEEEIRKWHAPVEPPKPARPLSRSDGPKFQKEEFRSEMRREPPREGRREGMPHPPGRREEPRNDFQRPRPAPPPPPPPPSAPKPPENVKKEDGPPPPIPLKYLGKHGHERPRTTPNKLVLKDALQKALEEREAQKPTEPASVPEQKQTPPSPPVRDEKPKEISEDVLRRVLE